MIQFYQIMDKVRVRYAPSPTGIPHVGNIRTALFNFLLAKSQNGDFILRIEDTDQKRLVKNAVEKIKESLKALGLIWDEEEVQSKRLDIYNKYLKLLKEKGFVYQDEGAWRFKVEKGKDLEWNDKVYKNITFKSDVIEDFVVIKSDNFPTYHFASVIDDHEMKISHVLRGEEWISSTPRHLLLYEALSWTPPQFVHMPTILGPDKKKLSKRAGAKTVFEYLDSGCLPEALVNFLALLGWSPKGDREIFSLEDLASEFTIDRINKNNPIFNLEKLRWFNNQWIKKIDAQDLAQKIHNLYPDFGLSRVKDLVPLVNERMFTLKDFKDLADFLFNPPNLNDIPPISVSKQTLSGLVQEFQKSASWTSKSIKEIIEDVAQKSKEDRIETIAAVRNIVSGKTVTPPLYESLEKLGKSETVQRLENYIKKTK